MKRKYSNNKLQGASNGTMGEEFMALFEACRRPILSRKVTSIGEFSRDELSITKVSYGEGEDSIDAYVLPKSVAKWPSFYD